MTKYKLVFTTSFKKSLRLASKRNKDISKLDKIVDILLCGSKLDPKYKDHILVDNKKYQNCHECHIEPDWLLIYKYDNSELILILVNTGSHSDLF